MSNASESIRYRIRRAKDTLVEAQAMAQIATGHLAAPAGDQTDYLVAFVVAILTRRMVPSLAAGLATIVFVALLRR